MTLSALITAYGDEHVEFQNLDKAFLRAQSDSRGVQITFGTRAVSAVELATNTTAKMGLVIWLDRKRVAELLAKEKGTM